MDRESLLTDLRYAKRQLTVFGDIDSALDALERIEEALAEAAPVPDIPEPWSDDWLTYGEPVG